MRRIIMIVSVALVMTAMVVSTALPVFGQTRPNDTPGKGPPTEETGPLGQGPPLEFPGQADRLPPTFGGQEPAAAANACKGFDKASPNIPFVCQ